MKEVTTNINDNRTEPQKKNKAFLIGIILVILLILGVTSFFRTAKSTESELFTAYFEPFPDVIVNRNEEESDLLTIGMAAYNYSDYTIAAIRLEQFLNRDDISEDNQKNTPIYVGISNLAIGNINSAVQYFKTIIEQHDTFKAQAEWYLALAYLKKGDLGNCEKKLRNIQSKSKHDYHSEAVELLKKIMKLKKN
ncbi:MAG: tetratricopeptide (TPR) repeat protein [Cognaticolwellia sp.]|jgi:tetratricopeptide (TPR) repeat protein|tara:strand:- start:562 stop:1143 length:582 start_codon:yes stop_codon:yes gene_type:complete